MPTMKSRGFTLIELLVVIAIIGILASVVLSSLNTARDKGADAAVKAELSSLRPQMQIYRQENTNSYLDACTLDAKVTELMNAAKVAVSPTLVAGGWGDGECFSTDYEWAAWVNLKSASTTAWCVDSAGKSGEIAVQNSTAVDLTVCP